MDKRRSDVFTPSTPLLSAPNTPFPRQSLPPTPQPLPQPQPLVTQPFSTPLPSSETFDIIPPLHEILSRLLILSSGAPAYKNAAPLEIQQLLAETAVVKNRIRKARRTVEELPDGDRGVEEQEREIAELRGKVEKQRGVLARVGRGGSGGGAEG